MLCFYVCFQTQWFMGARISGGEDVNTGEALGRTTSWHDRQPRLKPLRTAQVSQTQAKITSSFPTQTHAHARTHARTHAHTATTSPAEHHLKWSWMGVSELGASMPSSSSPVPGDQFVCLPSRLSVPYHEISESEIYLTTMDVNDFVLPGHRVWKTRRAVTLLCLGSYDVDGAVADLSRWI